MNTITGWIDPSRYPKIENSPTEEAVKCTKCKCQWFEQVTISRFSPDHYVLPGQLLPQLPQSAFVVLRCIKCSEIHEPNIQLSQQDNQRKLYDNFAATMKDETPK
jgi:hypothetical protein